jgi:hypothetical protein
MLRRDTHVILEPLDSDVVFGRAKDIFAHTGKTMFRSVIAMHAHIYGGLTMKSQKSALVNNLLSSMRRAGVRFLRPSKEHNGFFEVDDSTARSKVAHALRDASSKIKGVTRHQANTRWNQDLSSVPPAPSEIWRQVTMADHSEYRGAQHDKDDYDVEPIPLHAAYHYSLHDDDQDQDSGVLDEFNDMPLHLIEDPPTIIEPFASAAHLPRDEHDA